MGENKEWERGKQQTKGGAWRRSEEREKKQFEGQKEYRDKEGDKLIFNYLFYFNI